jgi:hypothetical protein
LKAQRVTFLTSPDSKTFLSNEARREGISVAELVRSRCERRPTQDEAMLGALTGELNKAVAAAKKTLKSGLDEAQAVLAELRARREGTANMAPTRSARKEAGNRS